MHKPNDWLIDKIEAAAKPCRELDIAVIEAALGIPLSWHVLMWGDGGIPRVTESLDAISELTEKAFPDLPLTEEDEPLEGWDIYGWSSAYNAFVARYSAELSLRTDVDYGSTTFNGLGATEALAKCAALARAVSARNGRK